MIQINFLHPVMNNSQSNQLLKQRFFLTSKKEKNYRMDKSITCFLPQKSDNVSLTLMVFRKF